MSSTGASSSKKRKSTRSISRISKAELTFPVDRVNKLLKKGKYANRVYTADSVYLTAVLEYLASEVLRLAGDKLVKNKEKRIEPKHIKQACPYGELKQLILNVTIPNADLSLRNGETA
ncbi:histone H2A [Castilleja foliolosa]|uniref:Histone H2A n=1 Tax=Castilleja foliolosa TaxID=1961234 RepID=A0ABD3E4C9_9LAMI